MISLDTLWEQYAAQIPGMLDRRPNFRFDPSYYASSTGLLDATPAELAEHYRQTGILAGQPATLYAELANAHAGVDDVLRELVIDVDLAMLIQNGELGALQLACELIALGAPVDAAVSNFSRAAYLQVYPDIADARIDPLLHFLCYGANEGRKTLKAVREAHYKGLLRYDKSRPTCLICVHEMSRTGAPIVGLDLAREASLTHNVIVTALRDGPLLEAFQETACEIIITSDPYHDFTVHSGESLEKIDYAIVNSAVAWPFVPFLVARDIPFASYLHEYAEYMRPAYPYSLLALFCDILIFSSEHVRASWQGRLLDMKFDTEKDSRIIPQRPLFIGGVDANKQTDARARLSRIVGRDLSKSRIVCGAGQSQWRKGTDIFAMAAQICKQRDDDTVFIWIGHGIVRDETLFGTYMAHHLDEIDAGMTGSNLFFIPAGPAYHDVLTASDVMFMSSRLDPLPNVVFDALAHGCMIVQFKGASGFNDEVYERSHKFLTVQYGNPEAAATAILTLPPKQAVRTELTKPAFPLFEMITQNLKERLLAQRYFICGSSAIDEPIMYTSASGFAESRVIERSKLLRYGRRRVWRDLRDVEDEISSSKNWLHNALRISPYSAGQPTTIPDFSLHIHAFYIDELAEDLKSYAMHRHACRIVVTTDTEQKGGAIRKIMAAQNLTPEIVLVPNIGRDILPFIKLFEDGGVAGQDEYWCHIHQKKSIGSTPGGDQWRRFLMRILFGDATSISNCLNILAESDVGVVAPFDPHYLGWDESRRLLPQYADGLPGPLPENPLLFPVGNMFWTRRSVVQAMNGLFGPNYPWPDEPIANDGTEYHLIERLWPAMAAKLGLAAVFVHKLDEKRL